MTKESKGIGATIAGAGAGAIMDIIQANRNRKRAKEMAVFNREQQMKFWEDTNYPAQVEQMKKAGLNIGLMYEGGGQTGQTTGANAETPLGNNEGKQMAIQASLALATQKAQIENLEANTRDKNADAKDKELELKVREAHGQDARLYEASNRKDQALQKGQYLYESFKDKGRQVNTNYLQALEDERVVRELERRIQEETEEDVKNQVAYETASKALDAQLKEANINLTKEQERKIWHDIWSQWVRTGFSGLDSIIKGSFKSIGKGLNKK